MVCTFTRCPVLSTLQEGNQDRPKRNLLFSLFQFQALPIPHPQHDGSEHRLRQYDSRNVTRSDQRESAQWSLAIACRCGSALERFVIPDTTIGQTFVNVDDLERQLDDNVWYAAW